MINPFKRKGEKGAELVEVAFVIVIFMVLMIAIFQFGRAYNIYQTITTAAREGARFAVAPQRGGTVNYPSNSEVRSIINTFLQSSNLDANGTGVTVDVQLNNQDVDPSCTPCTPTGGGCACGTRVSITYPFSFSFYGSINITTTALMRNES